MPKVLSGKSVAISLICLLFLNFIPEPFLAIFKTGSCTPFTVVEASQIQEIDGLRVVYLEGSPYELGEQHGRLLKDEVRGAIGKVLRYFRWYLKLPLVGGWMADWWLDRAWKQCRSFVPDDYLEELRGLAEGAGVRLQDLFRLHAVPDRTYACASLAAWGRATKNRKLIHVRNLDWNIDVGIQDFATIFVVRSEGKRAFINVGWAGFIGVLTGINEARLSIGQIGAETADASFKGEPMVFVMRRVLENAITLDEAEELVRGARRTVGVNYVIADAKAQRGIIIETTRNHAQTFEANDPAEKIVSYARPMIDSVFRADTAVDPTIRNLQIASNGNPSHPGLEEPSGGAYEVRYLGQAAAISSNFGRFDWQEAQRMARSIAPDSNIQSVIMSWPDIWVANARGAIPAAKTKYIHMDAAELLAKNN